VAKFHKWGEYTLTGKDDSPQAFAFAILLFVPKTTAARITPWVMLFRSKRQAQRAGELALAAKPHSTSNSKRPIEDASSLEEEQEDNENLPTVVDDADLVDDEALEDEADLDRMLQAIKKISSIQGQEKAAEFTCQKR